MRKVLFLTAFLVTTSGFCQDLAASLPTTLKAYVHSKQIKPTLENVLQLSYSTIAALYGFSNNKTGTLDSDRGEITNDTVRIYYDIGFSAGAHINDINKGEFDWSIDNSYEGYRTMVGIKKGKDSSQIVITIYGDDFPNGYRKKPFYIVSYPANFWAFVKTEVDIKKVLDLAWSYTPKPR